jgi:acyl-coenzyme A thioesterase 13
LQTVLGIYCKVISLASIRAFLKEYVNRCPPSDVNRQGKVESNKRRKGENPSSNYSMARMGSNVFGSFIPSVANTAKNFYGHLHGGVTCTLIDISGTLSLLAGHHPTSGTSIELNVNFLSSAKEGDTLDIYSEVLKAGKRVGFTQVDVMVKGKKIATGRHTKYYSPVDRK